MGVSKLCSNNVHGTSVCRDDLTLFLTHMTLCTVRKSIINTATVSVSPSLWNIICNDFYTAMTYAFTNIILVKTDDCLSTDLW